MNNKPDLASEFLNIIDEETRKLLGEKKAKEIRKGINKRLESKNLQPINWENDKVKVKNINIKSKINKIMEDKDNYFIGINRSGVKIEQSTSKLTVIEDEEELQLVTDNTDYEIRKENINTCYNSDNTITIEFNRYEKIMIRGF